MAASSQFPSVSIEAVNLDLFVHPPIIVVSVRLEDLGVVAIGYQNIHKIQINTFRAFALLDTHVSQMVIAVQAALVTRCLMECVKAGRVVVEDGVLQETFAVDTCSRR